LRQDIAKRVGGLIWSELVEQLPEDEESDDASDDEEPEAN
jgi:hypothetical protein